MRQRADAEERKAYQLEEPVEDVARDAVEEHVEVPLDAPDEALELEKVLAEQRDVVRKEPLLGDRP